MSESTELIVVQQLPIISEQLISVKAEVEARVSRILSLVCTEDTYKEIKKERAALGKEYAAFEQRRKAVKAEIMAPYEQFEAVYKECVGNIYAAADQQLKAKIAAVESGLKQQKAEEVIAYFDEYRDSLGIDAALFPFSASGITITLSESKKALKAMAKDFLDRVSDELKMIYYHEYRDEILVEYRRTRNAAGSILAVTERHKALEAEAARREEAERQAALLAATAQSVESVVEEEELQIPVPIPAAEPVPEPVPDDPVMQATFTVTAPRSKLIELRDFLRNGGYEYVKG